MTKTSDRWNQQHLSATSALALVAILSGCATAPPLIYPTAIELSPAQRESFSTYRSRPLQKAFAGSPDGLSGTAWLSEEANRAVRSAMSTCQRVAVQPCRVFDISGLPYQQAYLKFSKESREAIATMKVPRDIPYHLEAMDWGVSSAPSTDVRYQGPTPLSLHGAKSISTAQLADQVKSGTVTVIDSRGFAEEDLPTIPNARLIDWAGTLDGPKREPVLQQNFAKVMQLLQPERDKPVVVFCWSAQCWVAAHAVRRLQAIGYKTILWYRGGIEAWKAANLPVVTAVPYATVWSE